MDPLSDLLRVVHLAGAVFIEARLTGAWAYRSPRAHFAAPQIDAGADRVLLFDLVTEGECWFQLEGEAPRRATAGDAILFVQGDAHRMMSDPGVPIAAGIDLECLLARRPRQVHYGGDGALTSIVCGYLAFDSRVAGWLLDGLPRALCANVRASAAGPWLETSVRYALEEASGPRAGGDGVLAKLAEVLFAEVLRLHLHASAPEPGRTGWLAAMRDRVAGAALAAMHREIARDWTLEDLARESGTSRSVLAERFQAMVGTSPIQYLTRWRMLRAAHLISTTRAPLARVAEQVGYGTDTAFSRAFRREFGVPPAAWRRQTGRASALGPGAAA